MTGSVVEVKALTIVERLRVAAAGDVHDPELYLDAAERIESLLKDRTELDAVISSQRHEIQRLHRSEGVY